MIIKDVMPSFELYQPTQLKDAFALLDRYGKDGWKMAGGYDSLSWFKERIKRPKAVIDLGGIAELKGVRETPDGIEIGALTTLTEIERNPIIREKYRLLADAAGKVASPQIRNAGTIGGNLGTASPAGDTLPVLVALDAEVELASASGRRRLSVAEFLTGPKRTALAPAELIVAVRFPSLGSAGAQEYLKVGTRNAMVIAVASCAVVVEPAHRTVRVGLGSVGPVPLRAPAAEAWATEHVDWADGAVDDPDTFGRLVAEAARPIDDHRSTAAYRRHAVAVLAARGLRRCLRTATEAAA